jgi:hypothetical protein
VRAEQHLVARTQIGVGQERQDLARAVAADDAVGIEAVDLGEPFTQKRRAAVGIEMQRVFSKAAIASGLGPSADSFDDSL